LSSAVPYQIPKGQTTSFETDAIGRVTMQKDPLNRITREHHDIESWP
jgi:hypothetical protein